MFNFRIYLRKLECNPYRNFCSRMFIFISFGQSFLAPTSCLESDIIVNNVMANHKFILVYISLSYPCYLAVLIPE